MGKYLVNLVVQKRATFALNPEKGVSVTTRIATNDLSMSNAERDERTVELLTEALDRDPLHRRAIEAEVVALNASLAHYLANRYRRRGISDEDLRQVALLGLMKAIRGFTPGRATGFAAYAIPTIRGELRRHFRDAGWTIRPPRRIQELQPRIRSTQAELVHTLHREPTVQELATALGVEIDDILEATAVDSCFTPQSLDAPIRGNSGDLTIEPAFDDHGFDDAEARVVLEPALTSLAARDRRILDLRFSDGLTQAQIGEVIGISQMQVSRILTRVLGQMREIIEGAAA